MIKPSFDTHIVCDDARREVSRFENGAVHNLRCLTDKLTSIAHELASSLDDAPMAKVRIVHDDRDRRDPRNPRLTYAKTARALYKKRRARASIFGHSEIFGEPAWDMLLDLYASRAEGTPVSVSSACIASDAPATTGLRWLGVLCDRGLAVREQDPGDQRRVLVALTEQGLQAMDNYLAGTSNDA